MHIIRKLKLVVGHAANSGARIGMADSVKAKFQVRQFRIATTPCSKVEVSTRAWHPGTEVTPTLFPTLFMK